MKNTALILLAILVGVLSLLLYSRTAALRDQRRQVQELNRKLDSLSRTTSFDLQERCAKQADQEFSNLGWKKHEGAVLANHYNQKLNKCFMQVENSDVMGTWITISDAFEGKVYAVMGLHGDEVKKCSVTLLSGEEKTCHAPNEFDALVKEYMQ